MPSGKGGPNDEGRDWRTAAWVGRSRLAVFEGRRAGDFIYVSGQVPFGPDGRLVAGGIEPQARQALDNVKAALAEAGCDLTDVVKCTVWRADPRDFAALNRVYGDFFPHDPPARSTVRANLMIDGVIVAMGTKNLDFSVWDGAAFGKRNNGS